MMNLYVKTTWTDFHHTTTLTTHHISNSFSLFT
ncbi:hypothetical protein [Salmonella phage NINP13076]|nr:hypothetical protein [Salmonella phage NINP13076]